jgi:hypothetical protein
MANIPFLVDIDLSKNQMLNMKLQNLASHPVTTTWAGINLGFTYWNTTDLKAYSWNGATWSSLTYAHPNHTGEVTSLGDGTQTITANAVTNAKLAKMAAHTFKGNNTASLADPLDLTATQLTAELDVFTSTLKGLVPGSSGGSTTTFLRGDGSWATPAGSGDMVLAGIQSVTGLKTFDTIKLAVKGSSTGTTAIASANASATNYTVTLPTATGTLALTSDITGTNSGTNTGNQTLAGTSDATSHTTTLSASGGSLKLVEGSNISLTTTGTGLDAIVTIATSGGGTVTATGGALTANSLVLGAGTTDTKVVAGITTDGASVINLGVNTTTIGKIKFFGNTSGDATIQPSAVAGTATILTLPATTGTLALTSNIGTWGALAYPTYVSGTPFVKMTAAGTFSLDTTVYGTGTVTAIGVTTANGVSGTSSGGTTPSLTITLGAITPTTVNGHTFTSGSSTFTGTAAQTYTFPSATSTLLAVGIAATIPVAGVKSFDTGAIKFNGSASGTITLNAPSTAGANTITFPAATGTIALTSDITSALTGALTYMGAYDASVAPPTGAGILKGYTYTVTVAGNGAGFFGTTLEIGDMIIAEITNPIADANWTSVNKNITVATETVTGTVEIATQAEVTTGTNDGFAVTPLKLRTELTGANWVYVNSAFGNGVLTDIPLTHGLVGGSLYPTVTIFDTATKEIVNTKVVVTSSTVVTLTFNVAPTSGLYTVVIKK